jgi:hypothetical protein
MRLTHFVRTDDPTHTIFLPLYNATSEVMNWSSSIGVASTSAGFQIDTLSGAKSNAPTLSYSGSYKLDDSEQAQIFIHSLELFKNKEGTLYRASEVYQSVQSVVGGIGDQYTTGINYDTILAVVKSATANMAVRRDGALRTDVYVMTCSFVFQLLEENWTQFDA